MMRVAPLAVLGSLACAGLIGTQQSAAQQQPVVETGRAVYEYWCATCHAAGPGMPGTQALEVKYNGNLPAVLTQRQDLTAEFVAVIVRTGISVMPPFRKTEITDAELAALGEYIETEARAAQ